MDEIGQIAKTEVGSALRAGPISPLLCNVALNGLEQTARRSSAKTLAAQKKMKVQTIRYADDFIIVGETEEMLKNSVQPQVSRFLEERGLELHPTKTKIEKITNGIDFVGYHIKKHPYKHKLNSSKGENQQPQVLIIKPSKENIKKVKKKIKAQMITQKPMEGIIRDVNPILRG